MFSEIKSILSNDSVFYSLVILVVAIAAFGLGRLSVAELSQSAAPAPFVEPGTVLGVAVNPPEPPQPAPEPTLAPSGTVPTAALGTLVASKSGTKYHLPTCPGAQQIKETNKIYFETAAAARAAGYTPAANCPGLQ